MKIGFVVNNVMTEQKGYTTTRLGTTAINAGHEVWVMGAGELSYDPERSCRCSCGLCAR